jgi:hypothetical protein
MGIFDASAFQIVERRHCKWPLQFMASMQGRQILQVLHGVGDGLTDAAAVVLARGPDCENDAKNAMPIRTAIREIMFFPHNLAADFPQYLPESEI